MEKIKILKIEKTEEEKECYDLFVEDTHNFILEKGEITHNSGFGKSFQMMRKAKELGFKKGEDYEILNSYITPLSLYKFLYQNRDMKLIILDDVMKFFDNPITIGIILSALWGEGKRVINYHSTSARLEDIPTSFEFNSKLVWCVNEFPKNLETIKSRCFFYEMEFSYSKKIELFYELAKIRKIPLKIVDFLKENTDISTEELDFRMLLKTYELYKTNKNWKSIMLSLLKRDEKVILLKELIANCKSIKEAQSKWCEETGNHRATFFRIKKELTKS